MDGSQVIFSDLLTKVIFEEKYHQTLKTVALDLLSDSMAYLKNSRVPKRDIFERITTAALKSGLSPKRAKNVAFDILGAYAIRGAAYFDDNYVSRLKNSGSGLSLLILSTTMSYFDKITFQKEGRSFSLPRTYLSTTCAYGKPYHFWMAAYMSNLALESGKLDQRKSFLASHLLGVGYELKNKAVDFNGRDAYFDSVANTDRLDTVNVQNAKIDVVFNSFGAGFGVSNGTSKLLDGDAIIRKSLDSGFIPLVKAHPFQQWMNIVAPHAHINLIVAP